MFIFVCSPPGFVRDKSFDCRCWYIVQIIVVIDNCWVFKTPYSSVNRSPNGVHIPPGSPFLRRSHKLTTIPVFDIKTVTFFIELMASLREKKIHQSWTTVYPTIPRKFSYREKYSRTREYHKRPMTLYCTQNNSRWF